MASFVAKKIFLTVSRIANENANRLVFQACLQPPLPPFSAWYLGAFLLP